MLLENTSFHGCRILEVKEEASSQVVDILLDSPGSPETEIFEKQTLRLKDVIIYIKKEVPFSGNPIIERIKVLNSPKHTYKAFSGPICTSKYKIEIVTNAGSRFLEFADCELM